MKKVILASLCSLSILFASAQESKEKKENESSVPAPVKNKFASLYPGVKVDKWEKENGNYEAGFHKEHTKMSVLIDPAGNLRETETKIEVSELPKGVSDYVAKNKAGKKIKEAARIEDSKGVITYEAEVEKMDLIFDKDGKYLRESKD